jgi:hypothetical protein
MWNKIENQSFDNSDSHFELTVVVLALTLLLLKLEGDTANGSLLDTLHQVGGETGNLVAETLRGDDGNLIADLLVGVAVECGRWNEK